MLRSSLRFWGMRVAMGLGAVLVGAGLLATAAAPVSAASTPCDALCTRVRSELKVFTDWLGTNNAKGWIGEVGWNSDADSAKWNALANVWFNDADRANLWVTTWATGEWWPNSHIHSVYSNVNGASLDTARLQAPVVEAHGTTASYKRGINVNGGEFGAPSWSATTSTFSNASPGVYNTDWHYDAQGTFNYLASRGIKVVRLPFRWERIQPTLGGALDAAELDRLAATINRAGAAGITVIPQVFNYGGYMKYDGSKGVRQTIGTAGVTFAHFNDLWSRLSTALKANPNVAGYGLMNEPAGMTSVEGLTAAKVWEKAAQQALSAIRATGDNRLVLVPGYNWSGAQRWNTTHPTAWITDAANNFRYEAHHYWDSDNAGSYGTYAAELADAEARGYKATTIEDGTTTTTTAAPTTTTAAPTTTTAAPTTTTAPPTTTTAPPTTTTAPPTTKTVRFSGSFTSTTLKFTHKVSTGAGPLTATMTSSSPTASLTVIVKDSSGRELTRATGAGTAQAVTTVSAGTNRITVKGPAGTTYTLDVVHPLT